MISYYNGHTVHMIELDTKWSSWLNRVGLMSSQVFKTFHYGGIVEFGSNTFLGLLAKNLYPMEVKKELLVLSRHMRWERQFLLGGPGLEFDLFPPYTCELLLPHMCELCLLTCASLTGPGPLVEIPEKRVKHMIGIFIFFGKKYVRTHGITSLLYTGFRI